MLNTVTYENMNQQLNIINCPSKIGFNTKITELQMAIQHLNLTTNIITAQKSISDVYENLTVKSNSIKRPNFSHMKKLIYLQQIGAYDTVLKVREDENGTTKIRKTIHVPLNEKDVITDDVEKDILLLHQINQENFLHMVKLIDVCEGERLRYENKLVLYLFYEFIDYDLATYIAESKMNTLTPNFIKRIIFQTLNGLGYLHARHIIHHDLKPQNVLLTSSLIVKLVDFGFAKKYDTARKNTTSVVALWYRAPEVLLGLPCSPSIDIWSLGCIMVHLYNGPPLFYGNSEIEQLDKIFSFIGTPKEADWPRNSFVSWSSLPNHQQLRSFAQVLPKMCPYSNSLLQSMLRFKPWERISDMEALIHPYFYQ